MTKGVYVVATLTALFLVFLFCIQFSLPSPLRPSLAHPEQHPYYEALKAAEAVWSSPADDGQLASEQAKLLLAACPDDKARNRLFDALSLMFPEGAFLDDGVHMGMLNRMLGELTRKEEMQSLNSRIARICSSYGFGTLRFDAMNVGGEAELHLYAYVLAKERPISRRGLYVSGMTAARKTFSFLAEVPPGPSPNASPLEFSAVEDVTYSERNSLGYFALDMPLCMSLDIQFRILRDDSMLLSQPDSIKENIELVRVKRKEYLRFLPSIIVQNPELETAIRAIARAMKEHALRVSQMSKAEVLVLQL